MPEDKDPARAVAIAALADTLNALPRETRLSVLGALVYAKSAGLTIDDVLAAIRAIEPRVDPDMLIELTEQAGDHARQMLKDASNRLRRGRVRSVPKKPD